MVPVIDCARTGIVQPIEFASPNAIVLDQVCEFRVCEGELGEVGYGEEVHDDDPGFDGEAAYEGAVVGGGGGGRMAVWHEGGPSLCECECWSERETRVGRWGMGRN